MKCSAKNLLIFLFTTWIFSFARCMFRSLTDSLIRLFVILLLSFEGSLYILHNKSFLDIYFANIFSQSGAYLLPHYSVFCRAEVLILMKFNLSIIYGSFVVIFQKLFSFLGSSRCSPMLPFRSGFVWHFTFKFMIHF